MGGRNKIDVEPCACLHCGKEFRPKYASNRYCSQPCGVHSRGPRKPKPERRKVQRPPYDQLLAELQATSFLAVGRKYGVSDNAVRKWIRWYEYQREMEEWRKQQLQPGHEDIEEGA